MKGARQARWHVAPCDTVPGGNCGQDGAGGGWLTGREGGKKRRRKRRRLGTGATRFPSGWSAHALADALGQLRRHLDPSIVSLQDERNEREREREFSIRN